MKGASVGGDTAEGGWALGTDSCLMGSKGDQQHLSVSNPLHRQGVCSLQKERPVMKMKRRSILMPWRMHQLLSL